MNDFQKKDTQELRDKLPHCLFCNALEALPTIKLNHKEWLYLCTPCWMMLVREVLQRVYRYTMQGFDAKMRIGVFAKGQQNV